MSLVRPLALLLPLLLANGAPTKPAAKLAPNAELVVKFYNEVFNRHNVDYALKVMRPDYIQHNPFAATGRKAFMDYFRKEFKVHPNSRARIVRVIAQGDLFVLHVHSRADAKDRGRAVVDILRVQGGKIAEHWDTVQPVPEKSANANTMF